MKKYLITLSCLAALSAATAQVDTYVAPTGNMVTYPGAQMAIFGNLINDARGTQGTSATAQTGVNHASGGTVYLYRRSTGGGSGTGPSRIYDGPLATAAGDNYNAAGSAVRFYNLITDNLTGTATPSGTIVNGAGGAGHIQVEQEACITNLHTFTNGIVWTPRDKWKHAYVHYDANGAAYSGAGAGNTQYTSPSTNMQIDGYAAKTGNSNFAFPIGDGKYTRFSELSSPGSGTYKSAFFNKNFGGVAGQTTGISGNVNTDDGGGANCNGGLTKVNRTEGWDIDGTASSQFILWALNSVTGYSDWATTTNFAAALPSEIKITGFDKWENLNITPTPTAFSNDGPFTTTIATQPDPLFSIYTWATTASVLPITFSSYTATIVNCVPTIRWSSVNEQNVQQILVERSTNGTSFSIISTLAASGNGNGTSASYNYTDANATTGKLFYRLKIIDRDGSFKQSNIMTINNTCGVGAAFTIYPNPVKNQVFVSYTLKQSSKVSLNVYATTGELLQSKILTGVKGTNIDQLNIANTLSKGLYIVKIVDVDGGIIGVTKLVKE